MIDRPGSFVQANGLLKAAEKRMWQDGPSNGPRVWGKPCLPDYLICLVHLVSLIQPCRPTALATATPSVRIPPAKLTDLPPLSYNLFLSWNLTPLT